MSIGDEAEDWLILEATRAGLIVNRAGRDRAGWDAFFDLSRSSAPRPNDPLGLPTMTLSGRFQAKGTRKRNRRVPIKLSNWQRAIEDPLPWIFVVVSFAAGSKEPVEVAAIHLDRDLTGQVLRKLYGLDSAKLDRLHKFSFSLTWTDQHLLTPPYHESLKALVARLVPESLHAYAAEKKAWCETAGYTTPAMANARFTIRGSSEEEVMERVARAVIGLEESIEIADFVVERDRFGAPRPDPRFPTSGAAKLSVGPTVLDAGFELNVLDAHGSRKLSLPITFQTSASVIPELPKKFWLVRMQGTFLDMVMRHETGQVQVNFLVPPEAEAVIVRELLLTLEFLTLLDKEAQKPVRIEVAKGGKVALSGSFKPPLSLNESFHKLASDTKSVYQLAKHLDVAQDFRFSLREIALFASRAQFMLSARLAEKRVVSIDCNVSAGIVAEGDRVVVLADPHLILDGTAYVELIAIKGNAQIVSVEGTRMTVRVLTTDVSSVRSYRSAPAEVDKFPFDELANAAEKDLLAAGFKIVFTTRFSKGLSDPTVALAHDGSSPKGVEAAAPTLEHEP